MNHTHRYFVNTSIAFFFLCVQLIYAEISFKKLNSVLVDNQALILGDKRFGKTKFSNRINGCSFQQEAITSHKGFQYIAYYDSSRRVCIARRRLPETEWKTIRFSDYKFINNDAHNTISMGICPNDGTIHIAFDHHVHPLHYRISKKNAANNPNHTKWVPSLFSPIQSYLEKDKSIKITYPKFWQTPNGGLQFCYRKGGSGNGARMLVDYDSKQGEWKNTRQIDSPKGDFKDEMSTSHSRNSYPNGYTYGPKGYLHTTFVWRENAKVGANHDLNYLYSEDGGTFWKNSLGQAIKGIPNIHSHGIKAIDIPRKYGLMNTHGQAVDSQSRIHTVIRHCSDQSFKNAGVKPGQILFGPPSAHRYFHYFLNSQKKWEKRELPGKTGNRPKLFVDKNDNLYLICNISKRLVIFSSSSKNTWRDWKIIFTSQKSYMNEMLGDYTLWKEFQILSIMAQETPKQSPFSSPLWLINFKAE